jgi:hypothetical protein
VHQSVADRSLYEVIRHSRDTEAEIKRERARDRMNKKGKERERDREVSEA